MHHHENDTLNIFECYFNQNVRIKHVSFQTMYVF